MTLLAPGTRHLLATVLSPPDGFRLDRAIATTYSLDFQTLLPIPVTMAITDVAGRLDEFAPLIELVAGDEITEKNAREVVLRTMLDEGLAPEDVVEREGLGKAGDDAVAAAVEEAIAENPDAVEDYHAGEGGALNFLVGQVMSKTGGSADPGTVNGLLRDRLDG